jgi:REP element-mobilizing transposase RayT
MNRGLNRKAIYDNDKHRKLFLNLLAETFEQFGLIVHGYCLMDNHYHLLVQTPYANLPRAMRHINGVYTQRYNQNKKTDGPLFRGRYKSILIEGDEYLLQVSRYIHLNPLNANITQNLESYRWSSYKSYIGLEACPTWLQTEKILSIISPSNLINSYQQFILDGLDEETRIFYTKEKTPTYFGKRENRIKLVQDLNHKQIHAAITDYRLLEPLPSSTEVLMFCCEYFNCSQDEIIRVKRGRHNLVRQLAMYACRKWTLATLTEIADLFGGISINGVTNAIARTKRKIKQDKKLAKVFDDLTNQFENESST